MDAKVSLLNLDPSALRRAAELKEQIDELNEELSRILSGAMDSPSPAGAGGRRTMSAAGRARIAAAAKARWAKIRAGKPSSGGSNEAPSKTPRRKMSAAARGKIAAAARARWAKVKAAKG